MIIEIGKTLISSELVDKRFICDYNTCKGICCLEGDSGAPLTPEEDQIMKRELPKVLQYLSDEAKALIEEKGTSYIDIEGDLVTTINNGRECAFTHFTADGSCRCAYEMAYEAGDTDFPKPISCALYPVRVKQYKDFVGVNYDEWDICKCAEVLGEKMGTPAYKFLEKPLIRRFGKMWYEELTLAAKQLEDSRDQQGS